MIHQRIRTARRFAAALLAATIGLLTIQPVRGQAQPLPETTRARVRALQAGGSAIEVTLSDGTRFQGRVVDADDDSFGVREDTSGREVAWPYAQVSQVRKQGLTGGKKAALIAAIIGGSVLVVLCVAPFPIGFLCRSDPS